MKQFVKHKLRLMTKVINEFCFFSLSLSLPLHSVVPFHTDYIKVKSRRSSSLQLNEPLDPSAMISDLERQYVAGVEGTRAVLPCNVTRPTNDTVDLILWFRGADEKALYSIDARRAPTMQRAKHFSGDELGARAYIDLSTRYVH